MAKVISMEAFRFYNAVKAGLRRDGISCKFSYDDETFVNLTDNLQRGKLSYPEFYTMVAAHAMELDSITVGT